MNRSGNKKPSGYERMRSSMHIAMGGFYIMAGSLILYVKHFGLLALQPGLAYALGGMMLVYGAFRIWRGWRQLRSGS